MAKIQQNASNKSFFLYTSEYSSITELHVWNNAKYTRYGNIRNFMMSLYAKITMLKDL